MPSKGMPVAKGIPSGQMTLVHPIVCEEILYYADERKRILLNYIKENLFHPRFLKFGIVGGSGIVVNMGILYLLTQYVGLYYLISSIIAIELSILSNFFLNDIWTWKDRQKKTYIHRLMQYHISVGVTAVVANWILLILLTELVGLHYMISNLIGISVGTLFNYIINDLWTFRHQD